MRTNCSALAHDLYRNHVTNSLVCRNCTIQASKTAQHYLLQCPKYNDERYILKSDLNFQLGNHRNRTSRLLLHGDPNISNQIASKHCYCPLRQCFPSIDETVLISLVVLFFTLGLNSMPITHAHYIPVYLRW
jgi:hypothetical protein